MAHNCLDAMLLALFIHVFESDQSSLSKASLTMKYLQRQLLSRNSPWRGFSGGGFGDDGGDGGMAEVPFYWVLL